MPVPPHPADLEQVLRTFTALSEAVRVQILLLLGQQERPVGGIAEALGLPQSTVSRHLAVLRNADLVVARREGPRVFYRPKSHVADLLTQAFAHVEHRRLGLPEHEASVAHVSEESA